MSVPVCTACLTRLRLSAQNNIGSNFGQSTSFHTSTARYASPLKKKTVIQPGSRTPGLRQSRSANVKTKRNKKQRPNPPAIGEVRTQRKRIVLSNANAPDVPGMQDLSADNMTEAKNIGRVLGFQGDVLDQLREAKAFKTSQHWNLFRRPATLVREETIGLGQDFEDVNNSLQGDAQARTIREIITGDRLSGKSLLMLQAMSMAFMNKWIVISIPEAQEYVINQSSYAPGPSSKTSTEQLYVQPNLTSELLSRMVNANSDVLGKLKIVHDHSIPGIRITPKMSLKDLAQEGASDLTQAWSVWEAVWKELTSPPSQNNTKRPPPILFTVDSIDHWMQLSKYRSADYSLIHSHQFLLIRQYLSLLFSQTQNPLPNGGMVLAATSFSNSPSTPSFDLLIRQVEAAAADQPLPEADPYGPRDERVTNLLNDNAVAPRVRRLSGLNKAESKGLLDYFARSGVMQDPVNDTTVAEKWTLSGGGVIGELAKLGSRLRL